MRSIIRYALAGAILVALSGTGVGAQPLHVVHYGGTADKLLRNFCFGPAEKAIGVKIVDMSRTDYGKIKAMVEAKNIEWDVALVNTLLVKRAMKEKNNLFEPIDWTVIDPKVQGQIPRLEHSVTYLTYSQGLAYSTQKYPDPATAPKSWADFWDVKKFPGPRALENRVRYELEAALVADGVPPGKLYPLDVERAFRKLDEIKPHITAWSNPPVQAIDLIASGEVVMAMSSHHEVRKAKEKGIKIEFVWPGSLYITNDWAILRGSPNKQKAMEMIRFCTGAEPEAEMAKTVYFGPPNPEAIARLSAQDRAALPTSPENLKQAAAFDPVWWGDNEEKLIERWNAWLLKK